MQIMTELKSDRDLDLERKLGSRALRLAVVSMVAILEFLILVAVLAQVKAVDERGRPLADPTN
jgi:hypothetical protein